MAVKTHTSIAIAYANVSLAALDALYNAMGPMAIFDAIELMLMIRPPRGITGTTACVMYRAAKTLIAKVCSMSSLLAFKAETVAPPPALLTACPTR